MAFDPSKYPAYSKPKSTGNGFDPSKYPAYSKDTQGNTQTANSSLLDNLYTHLTPNIPASKEDATLLGMLPGANYIFGDKPPNLKQEYARGIDTLNAFRAGIQNPASDLISHLPGGLKIPRYQPTPSRDDPNPESNMMAGKIAASFIPGTAAERSVMGASKLLGLSPSLITKTLAGAAGGAASAPSVDADPRLGAAIGGGLSAIPELGYGALTKLLGKNVTPEEFQAAREAVPEGIKAPIGELAESPFAKTGYKTAQSIAFSGANKPYEQLHDYLSHGLKALAPEDVSQIENANKYVYNSMRDSYEAAKKSTDNAYKLLGEEAESKGTPFIRKSYDKNIDKAINEINKKIVNKTTQKIYGSTLSALKDFKETPIKKFKDAVDIRPAINDLLFDAVKNEDKIGARALGKLKEGLDNSIAESAASDPELYQHFDRANKSRIYQGSYEKLNNKDYSPFYKVYSKKAEPDNLIGSYLRTSNKGSDYSGLLKNLTSKLSDDAKNVLAAKYINPTGMDSTAKQINKISKLTPSQRELLFGEKSPVAHEIVNLSNRFPSAKGADFTPLTGYLGGKGMQVAGETGALLAGALTGKPSLMAAALASPASGRAMQMALRSNWLKNAYQKALEDAYTPAAEKSISPKNRAMRTALISVLGGEKKNES